MSEYSRDFNPVDRNIDPQEVSVEHFKVTPEHIVLSPDEAWVIKHYIRNVDEESPYHNLSVYLSDHFVAGVYETRPEVLVSHEQAPLLAGAYMGIFWELQPTEPEKAKIVKEKIDAILEDQAEDVKSFFRSQLAGPTDSPKHN